jgi:hypothetical protein
MQSIADARIAGKPALATMPSALQIACAGSIIFSFRQFAAPGLRRHVIIHQNLTPEGYDA